MKIDVSDILKKKIFKKNLDVNLKEDGFYDGIEYINFIGPIKFNGKLRLIDDILHLEGTAILTVELVCSRCLEKFSTNVELDIYEKFSNNVVNKDDDCIFINSDEINITEVIEYNLIEMLPIKRLCKEDCSGLCSQCGINLNNSTCDCKKEHIDPRLAKLKDLFTSN
ncbi:YceD family protein [Clostridium rectalis]|uniref:YceD family protein n=1 Tax=Clostridium rectalis TaxID=2040295 RepID=UPI000F62C213|nr:DUF177 domain-containing protein [Clostridium rectalis]